MTSTPPPTSAEANLLPSNPASHAVHLPPILPATNGDAHPLRTLCANLHADIAAFLAEDVKSERLRAVQKQTRRSVEIIHDALERFPLPALSLSYNGGKDCLLLLTLYLSCLATHPSLPPSLPAIYIPPPDPFPAVDSFVASSSKHYKLALARYAHPSMRGAFAGYLDDNRHVQAILVGTRRTDPHGTFLRAFQRTDHGWPDFMRVHPVIEWRYAEVWAFLRHLKIPYCELYDQGYTSLGGTTDTHPNPVLRIDGIGDEGHFRPAYELEEDSEERLGRDR